MPCGARWSSLDAAPLTLDDVQTRAKRIQRRRRITASVAAAAVVAIIAPVGLVVADNQTKSSPPPATQSQVTPSPLDWPQRLQTGGLALGDAPKIAWREGGTLHTADGRDVTVDASYFQLVPYDDGWLAWGSTDIGYSATILDSQGNPVGEPFTTGEGFGIAVNETQVLYLEDDALKAHDNTSGETTTLRTGLGPETQPVGFSGDAALYNVQLRNGERDARWIEAGGDEQDPKPVGTYVYADTTGDGWSAALTKVTDDGSCSQTTAPQGNAVGQTCDFTLAAFSPDGEHVLAGPAYRDGYGDRVLAVVPRDHVNGSPPASVHYVQTLETDATFMSSMWEDDDHVLVVTTTPIPSTSDKMWGLVRIGVDGSVENAVEPVRADEFGNAFGFASG